MEATPHHPPSLTTEPPGSGAPRGEAMIELSRVGKTFPDGTRAVDDVTLTVGRGQICCLVGPSGCGKSTTLKMINRLIEPSEGTIRLDGADVTHGDPVALRRRIGYVIQQVGLFPHQTIARNVATVPHLLGRPKAEIGERVRELLTLVGLDPEVYADRYPHQLSGGQRQRVGVARALAADPPVLLMDEPFGAVDPVVRVRLQQEFRSLQQRLGTTVVMVTHDIDEAVAMGDAVAVFREGGRLAQEATPLGLLAAPADDFVADFVGSTTSLRRLSVTPIRETDLEALPTQSPPDPAPRVLIGQSLEQGLTALLTSDVGWALVSHNGRDLGVLTPAGVHRALRRALLQVAEASAPPEPGGR